MSAKLEERKDGSQSLEKPVDSLRPQTQSAVPALSQPSPDALQSGSQMMISKNIEDDSDDNSVEEGEDKDKKSSEVPEVPKVCPVLILAI